jgi:large subunit ribosomal protein L37Ae
VVKIAIKKEKTFGSVKRFGVRYGRTVKHNLSKIEEELRKKHKCPYCHNLAVKRLALGIWYCKKCDSKFTGKAYSISKSIVVRKRTIEAEQEAEMPEKEEKGEKYRETVVREEEANEAVEEGEQ